MRIAKCYQLQLIQECSEYLNTWILFLSKRNIEHSTRFQLKLLHSGHLSDMEFEVITTASVTDDTSPVTMASPVTIIAPSNNGFDFNTDGTSKKEYHIFKAHRVIVAARCEYLKKALLSGMQEDIHR